MEVSAKQGGPLHGGRRDREEWQPLAARGLYPIGHRDFCEGLHPAEYVTGIDFYCDGSASRSAVPHNRVVVGRFRRFTCSKVARYGVPVEEFEKVWMRTNANGTVPEDGRRFRLVCDKCTVDIVVTQERMTAIMTDVWGRHARAVHRRNVSELLT